MIAWPFGSSSTCVELYIRQQVVPPIYIMYVCVANKALTNSQVSSYLSSAAPLSSSDPSRTPATSTHQRDYSTSATCFARSVRAAVSLYIFRVWGVSSTSTHPMFLRSLVWFSSHPRRFSAATLFHWVALLVGRVERKALRTG